MKFLFSQRLMLVVLIFLFTNSKVIAQTDWLNWNGVDVSSSLTDKLSAKFGHTRAFNVTNKYENVFNQTSFQLSYELTKKWDIYGGVQLLSIPDIKSGLRKRVFVRAAYTSRLNPKLNWTNSIRAETNSKNENRFSQRVILTTRLGLRKRLAFLKLAPSISYSLFYNLGGGPIRYYDENAQLLARQTADGLHRSRVSINLNSKISPYFSVTLYYMRQQEFNLLTPATRKINVYDPVRNIMLRPFNNYNTIGLTAKFNIDPLIRK